MRIELNLTKREVAAIIRSNGFDHGWGVRKSAASQSATRKLLDAIEDAEAES